MLLKSFRQLRGGALQRGRQEIDMLLGVAFVPWQHQNAIECAEGPGELLAGVVDGFGSRQRKRPAARAERPLLAEDLAREGRLLDVPGRRRNVVRLQRL